MLMNIGLLVLGFILLIKGADIFIDGGASLASHFKVPKMLIGLTIIAFGTSAPELAVSFKALFSGNTDIVLGNVIGSCILNILLILGVASVINPIKIKKETLTKEIPFCLLASTLLLCLFLNKDFVFSNQFKRFNAIIILLFFAVFVYYLFLLAKKDKGAKFEKPKLNLGISIIYIIIGLLGVILGSDLVVDNAVFVASKLGVSTRVIALTIVALGTSLPELVTTIISSKKGEQDLLLGNIIGSNIFNICIVFGLPIALYGTVTLQSFNPIDLIILVLSSLLLFVFAATKKTIKRYEGGLMLLTFILYYIYLFIQ